MAAVSPGSYNPLMTEATKEQSSISSYSQQHPANLQALQAFQSIIKSCYGPRGHLKMVQNQCGGHVTVTSSSKRLLSAISLSKPVLKLVSAAVEGHLRSYSDNGLYTALLACSLVEGCWTTGVHPAMCAAINELLLDRSLQMLETSTECRMHIDVASMEALQSLVKSVIGSKPACGLIQHEVSLVSSLVLQSFISSLPSADHNQRVTIPEVQIVTIQSQPVSDSRIIQGILVEAPEMPATFTKDILLPRAPSGPREGCVLVALYGTSLAGDSEEFVDGSYELHPGVQTEAATLMAMGTLVDQLVDIGVGLVACQKVIHPSVKRRLRQRGLLAIDRLSLHHIGAVQQITGAEILTSLDPSIPASSLGHLTDVRHHVMFGRSFIHLTNQSSSNCTLVLCNHTEEALEELKHVTQVALHTLALTLKEPVVVPGVGCLESILAHHTRLQAEDLDDSMWSHIGCTRTQFAHLVENFASCLDTLAMAADHDHGHHITDSASHHHWLLPQGSMADPDWLEGLGRCGCGMKSASDLRGSEWSVTGSLKCGTHKMEAIEALGSVKRNTSVVPLQEKTAFQKQNSDTNEEELVNEANGSLGNQTAFAGQSDNHNAETVNPLTKGKIGNGALVLDSYVVKRNAFCIAVETANMVLRIGHTVEDVN